MKEYTEKDDNFYDFVDLTPASYIRINADTAEEIATRSKTIDGLTMQFDDANRQIKAKKKEIARLKKELSVLTSERRKIGKHLREENRSLRVDVRFSNALNRGMKQPDKHLVKVCDKRVITKKP